VAPLISLLLIVGCAGKTADDTADDAGTIGDIQLTAPSLSVTPSSLDFGELLLPDELTASRTLTLTNSGDAQLGPVVFELDDTTFEVDTSELVLLAPGESAEVEVTYLPDGVGMHDDALHIRSDDPENPVQEVALSGALSGGILAISPEVYDFGEPYIGCVLEQTITLDNVGTVGMSVTSLEYATGSADLVFDDETDLHGPLPWLLSPEGAPFTVTVRYTPTDEVPDIGYLKVHSDDPFTPTLQVSQEGGGVIYGTNTDVYEQRESGPVDILFGVDKSCSMDDDIQNVKANFELFASTLAGQDSDYHIGVVVEDSGCFSGSVNYINSEMTTSAQQNAFDDMLSGVAGTYTEAPFQLMSNALSQSHTGGCNEDFLRETATLALVSVSDEREQSPNGWEYYVALFQALKADNDDVIMHAIAGDMPAGCDTNEAGTGHYEATLETGGEFLSICSTDFGAHLQAIALASISANDTFELSMAPDPASISVAIDKTPVSVGWYYSGYDDGNYISFDEGYIPAAGSTVEIAYLVKPDCHL